VHQRVCVCISACVCASARVCVHQRVCVCISACVCASARACFVQSESLKFKLMAVSAATHCSTVQHSAAMCSTVQHTRAHCNALQKCILRASNTELGAHKEAINSSLRNHFQNKWNFKTLQDTARHCKALKHAATSVNTLQHAWRNRCEGLIRATATHCNTLQHIATHCNTLQHIVTH